MTYRNAGARAALVIAVFLLPRPVSAGVGTVAIVEGHAFVQKGEIYYTRPNVGSDVKVNKFGQYKDVKPPPAFVKWSQSTRRLLRPNDAVEEGDIIQTMGDSFVKILFRDDSLLDVGPAALFQIKKYAEDGDDRDVFIKTLYGRFRSVVAKALRGPQKYQIATPSAIMGVRGTEFLFNVFSGPDRETHTEVVCIHGQVSLDVARHTNKGLVYHQPVVVNPGTVFATSGVHGIGQATAMRALPQEDLRVAVTRASPQVNVRGTLVGASPPPNRLAGTGLKMQHFAEHKPRRREGPALVSTFDLDKPPPDRVLAAASGNFQIPKNFKGDPGAFGSQLDLRRFTGVAPISLLPASTARVTVRFGGI